MVERFKSSLARKDKAKPDPKRSVQYRGLVEPFQKGNSIGRGRPKGIPNRIPKLLKDAATGALEELGFLEPLWLTEPNPKSTKKKPLPDIKVRIIGWKPTGVGGTKGYLVWLGCNEPAAMAGVIKQLIPLQANITTTIDATVTSKLATIDLTKLSLDEKLALSREMLSLTRALPAPSRIPEQQAISSSSMIEGEIVEDGD
jgi:hypothetical protein